MHRFEGLWSSGGASLRIWQAHRRDAGEEYTVSADQRTCEGLTVRLLLGRQVELDVAVPEPHVARLPGNRLPQGEQVHLDGEGRFPAVAGESLRLQDPD